MPSLSTCINWSTSRTPRFWGHGLALRDHSRTNSFLFPPLPSPLPSVFVWRKNVFSSVSFWQYCLVVCVLGVQLKSKLQPAFNPSWFEKTVQLVYNGNTLEVSYLAIVFVALDKHNVFSCVDVIIVGCCLLSPLYLIKRVWPALTAYWLVVFVFKWVCVLLNKRFLSYFPWADWTEVLIEREAKESEEKKKRVVIDPL